MATIPMGRNTMSERDRLATRRFYWAVLAAIVILFALGLMVKSSNVRRLMPQNFGTTPSVVNPGP
jgi:cell division protein FtsN